MIRHISLVYGLFREYDELCFTTVGNGFDCYVPITYQKSCRVVMYTSNIYFRIHYTTPEKGSTVETFTYPLNSANKAALTSANETLRANTAEKPTAAFSQKVAPGKQVTMFRGTGVGAIRYITLDIDIPSGEFDTQIYLGEWDYYMGCHRRRLNGSSGIAWSFFTA